MVYVFYIALLENGSLALSNFIRTLRLGGRRGYTFLRFRVRCLPWLVLSFETCKDRRACHLLHVLMPGVHVFYFVVVATRLRTMVGIRWHTTHALRKREEVEPSFEESLRLCPIGKVRYGVSGRIGTTLVLAML